MPGEARRQLVQLLHFVGPARQLPVVRGQPLRLPPCQNPVKIKKTRGKGEAAAARASEIFEMQIRVITLRYKEALQGFPEDALKASTFGREVLGVTEHFFVHGNVPHLTLVLSLGDSPMYENSTSYRMRDPNTPNPEEGLTDDQKLVYRALKQWRNETSKAEGRPAYAIARNVQLSELVKILPNTLSGLREVEGFGESFCEKYGQKVLSLISELQSKKEKSE